MNPPPHSKQLVNELLHEPGTPTSVPVHVTVVCNAKYKYGSPSRLPSLGLRAIHKTKGLAQSWIYKNQIFKIMEFNNEPYCK